MELWKFLILDMYFLKGIVTMRALLKLEAELWCIGTMVPDIVQKGRY